MPGRKLDRIFIEYGKSHRNSTNILIHWIFEPAAVWSLMALAYATPVPQVVSQVISLNWLAVMLAALLIYYATLSLILTIGLAFVATVFTALIAAYPSFTTLPIVQFAIPLFVISWCALLLGHRIEGNWPSVFRNPHLIFAGPPWLINILYRRLGIAY